MVQRTVLKVDLSCSKCKKKLLKAVSALEGVDKVEADVANGTLSVTGNADPYKIIVSARKAAGRTKHADVVSVGPPPAPPKPPAEAPKKADEKKDGGGGGGEEANKKAEEKKKNKEEEDHIHQGVVSNFHDPHTCPECQRIVFVPLDNYRAWNSEPNPSSCSIM